MWPRIFFLLKNYVFFSLLAFAQTVLAGVTIPRSLRPIKLNDFEVEAFDINKGLLAYRIVYEVWDWAGEIDETGEANSSPPFLKCSNQQGSPSTAIEVGIIDLSTQKVSDVFVLQKPVREKELCTTKVQSKKRLEEYKAKMANLGLRIQPDLKVSTLDQFSKSLKFESVLGRPLAAVFNTLNAQQRSEVFGSFCGYFENEKSIDGTTGNSAGLNYIQDKNRMLYLQGFCPNLGALSTYDSYQMRGVLGTPESFVGVLDVIRKKGATVGPDANSYIEFTNVIHKNDVETSNPKVK